MDGIELVQALERELSEAESCVNQMPGLGKDLAEAEREYRIALSAELLNGKAQGVPATILPDVCRGREDVALKRFRRDCAQAIMDANVAAYNLHKKKADAIRDGIKAEWQQAGRVCGARSCTDGPRSRPR